MQLSLTAPDQVLYTGSISSLTVPTELWEITILPGHQPLVSVVRQGMLRIIPNTSVSKEDGYILEDGKIVIAVSKGLLSIQADTIIITTSAATASVQETTEVLETMRAAMEEKIKQIKVEGNEQDLEEAIENLEKITAELRLAKIKYA